MVKSVNVKLIRWSRVKKASPNFACYLPRWLCLWLGVNLLLACTPIQQPPQQQLTDNSEQNTTVAEAAPQSSVPAQHTVAMLNSWQAGAIKQAIEHFVQQSIQLGGKHYLPVAERVAVFDLDGSLWVERPQKAMMAFIHKELIKQLQRQPSLKSKQPWKSVARGDEGYLQRLNYSTLYLMLLKAHEGQAQTAYDYYVQHFFKQAKHPEYKKNYLALAYQPMQALIRYLQAHQYQVYLVDSSDTQFMRALSQTLFNIPVENVIGSSAMLMWRASSSELIRGNEFVAPINNDEGKPVNIERHIGRRPVIAVGNDDNDIAMLNYVASGKSKSLLMLVKHDDAVREYRYNKGAEQIQALALEKKWLVISIKNDFKQVF